MRSARVCAGLATWTLLTGAVVAAEPLLTRPGGAASDPLAVVTFTDLRLTSNDLEGGSERDVFSVEGAYVFHPKFKVTYDANYWRTDVTGSTESGWADFRTKAIYFPRTRLWQGLVYRTAVGLDLRIDTGNVDKGIGDGADQLGVLAGLQLLFSRQTRLSIFGEYRKSFDSEPGRDLEQTVLGLVAVRSIPSVKSWLAANLIFVLDHENDGASTTTINLQAGRSFTPTLGAYLEALLPVAGRDVIQNAVRLTLRIQY